MEEAAGSHEAKVGTPTTSVPPHSIGQNKSHGQLQMQKENRFQFSMRGTTKSHHTQELAELGYLCKQFMALGEARRFPGGRDIVAGF